MRYKETPLSTIRSLLIWLHISLFMFAIISACYGNWLIAAILYGSFVISAFVSFIAWMLEVKDL
jgi:hypothetical protein